MKKIYKKKYMHNPNLTTIEGLIVSWFSSLQLFLSLQQYIE